MKKIAIIGGGTSGLAVAYYLQKQECQCTVFESAHHVGGNARSHTLTVRGVKRWVDLGVNDFNANTYVTVKAVMDELGVEYKPLLDTTCFSSVKPTQAGAPYYDTGFTMSGTWVTDPEHQEIRDQAKLFQKYMCEHWDEIAGEHHKSIYDTMTVGQFFERHSDIFSEDFIFKYIYPRINGMYFEGFQNPADVPLLGILHYYSLQEGWGQQEIPAPERMYFANGANNIHAENSWIPMLSEYLQNSETHSNPVEIRIKTTIDNYTFDEELQCYTLYKKEDPESEGTFDTLIFGLQARSIVNSFSALLPKSTIDLMKAFEYRKDEVVVHTDREQLAPDNELISTYNIDIFPDYPENPYYISYCVNDHQNDSANPKMLQTPQFYLTINPTIDIPHDKTLLPRTLRQGCTMFSFFHNILNFDAMDAQSKLTKIQGENSIFFVGGYTQGAGLHEECWVQAKEVSQRVMNPDYVFEDCYDFNAVKEKRQPKYLRRLFADRINSKS